MSKVRCKIQNSSPGFLGFSGGGLNISLGPREIAEKEMDQKLVSKVASVGLKVEVLGPAEEQTTSTVAESPAEEPPAEEPPTEDPPAEDPPAEDPPAEDPPAEDPPAEEPEEVDLVEALMVLTKAQLARKCAELDLDVQGNKRTLAEALAEGRTAEELGV